MGSGYRKSEVDMGITDSMEDAFVGRLEEEDRRWEMQIASNHAYNALKSLALLADSHGDRGHAEWLRGLAIALEADYADVTRPPTPKDSVLHRMQRLAEVLTDEVLPYGSRTGTRAQGWNAYYWRKEDEE